MKDIEKRKGFTLIELLVTIIIVALLFTITYGAVKNIFASTEVKKNTINDKFVISASEMYAEEYIRGEKNEKYTKDGVTDFCISLKTLLNYGIYRGNDVLKQYSEDNRVVHVSEQFGVYDYEIIDASRIDNDCLYSEFYVKDPEKGSGDIEITETSDEEKEESSGESGTPNEETPNSDETSIPLLDINYNLKKEDANNKKKYTLDLTFKSYPVTTNSSTTLPFYVALVLDKSISMNEKDKEHNIDCGSSSYYKNTKYCKAVTAAKTFSENLVKDFKNNAYISLVQFAEDPVIKRYFPSYTKEFDAAEIETRKLQYSNFDTKLGGWTNLPGGIDYASKLFYSLKKDNNDVFEKALKYTILLYDGEPNYTSKINDIVNTNEKYYTDSNLFSSDSYSLTHFNCFATKSGCSNYITSASNYLKGDNINSELITVGYKFTGDDNLKKISSQNSTLCPDSNYTDENNLNYCYYEAETDNSSIDISSLFEKIQNSITDEVNKTKAVRAVVTIELNEEVESLIDLNTNAEEKDNFKCTTEGSTLTCNIKFGNENDSFASSYGIAFRADAFKRDNTIKVFESFNVVTYDKNDNPVSTEGLGDYSPIIPIVEGIIYTLNDYKNESKY